MLPQKTPQTHQNCAVLVGFAIFKHEKGPTLPWGFVGPCILYKPLCFCGRWLYYMYACGRKPRSANTSCKL